MANNYKKIVWVKTPRCAGTALKRFLLQYGKVHMYYSSESDPKILPLDKLSDIPVVGVEAFYLNDFIRNNFEIWKESYKITTIRNPFDKFVSAWLYMYTGQGTEFSKTIPNVKYTIEEMVDNLPNTFEYEKPAFHITETQTNLISDEHGHINYDKIIRYETLKEDLFEIFKRLGIEKKEFGIVNSIHYKREFKDYKKYYTYYSKNMVEKIFWMDLKLFGYEY